MQPVVEALPPLELTAVFTLLFVTLGPIKLMAPFAQATRDIDEGTLKRIAMLTFAVGTIAVLAGGIVGKTLLASWKISLPAIMLTGAVIFLLVGLRLVLEPYAADAHTTTHSSLPARPLTAAFQLAFPLVVTPYGLAAVIALLANHPEAARMGAIIAILIAIMTLNLVTMLYIRRIMGAVTVAILQVFGAMLAVLQVALAVQIILRGLRELGLS